MIIFREAPAHFPHCPDQDDSAITRSIGRQGDPIVDCPCGMRTILKPYEGPQQGRPSAAPAPIREPRAWSPYRCRSHQSVVVDARGKGCAECRREREQR